MNRRNVALLAMVVLVTIVAFAPVFAAGRPDATTDRTEITVWGPFDDRCDPSREAAIVPCQIAEFNEMQHDIVVRFETGPIDAWTDFVQAGAAAGDLPDLIYIDGPTLAYFAWSGHLRPMDDLLPSAMREDFLDSVIRQGTYEGRLYALGVFDSGLGIWGNRRYLEKAGVRIPTSVADAWTRREFEEALGALQALPETRYAMDMKMNYGQGEWFTYGFSPIVQSMGGDLINRDGFQTAQGVLNGTEAVQALTMFQTWFERGYVDANPAGDTDFDQGETALSWVGHWMYTRYKEALRDDLVLLPMPKLGDRAATGTGSWAWVIGADTRHPEAAWEFMEHLLSPEQIVRMTDVAGAVPARRSALALSDLYRPGGDAALFAEQLDSIGVERPVTPAYPTITLAFAEAINNIANGADVKTELDRAVARIDQDIRDNEGYPVR